MFGPSVKTLIQQGAALEKQGQSYKERALAKYKEAKQRAGNSSQLLAQATIPLAKCYISINKYKDAIKECELILDRTNAHFSRLSAPQKKDVLETYKIALNKMGDECYRTQNYDDALEHYLKAKQEKSPEAYKKLGNLYEHGQGVTQNYLKAAQYYQQAKAQGYIHAQTDLDRLFNTTTLTGEDANRIGVLYHQGDNIHRQDFAQAKRWFEHPNAESCATAHRNLGVLYENGQGVTQNYVTAAQYYQQAKAQGYIHAQTDLDRLFNSPMLTGQQANNIGMLYHRGDNIHTRDFAEAKRWFEHATTKQYAAAYRNVGALYECGQGVTRNYVTAAQYYQQAKAQGYTRAQNDLDRLFNTTTLTGEDAYNIGNWYYRGDNICPRDYAQAKRWFERTITTQYAAAYRNLGFLYEKGNGVTKNYVTAAQYYQQAKDQGYTRAQTDLDRLFNTTTLTGEDANRIGVLYHQGDNVPADYAEAKRWYDRAITKQPPATVAYRNIGVLYENGFGNTGEDLLNAGRYYRKAKDAGYDQATQDLERIHIRLLQLHETARQTAFQQPDALKRKKELKRIERKLATTLWQVFRKNDAFWLKPDTNGYTALHRGIQDRRWKDCARIVFLNAETKNIFDSNGLRPFHNLNGNGRKITALQNQIASLITKLQEDAPKIISDKIVANGVRIPIGQINSVLNEMFVNPDLKPLLELTKLAILGLHDLSTRPRYTSPDQYDSDDDDTEPLNDQQHLSINFDGARSQVDGVAHHGIDGQFGNQAVGMYVSQGNTISVAAGPLISVTERRATLIHEITHFVADEAFRHHRKPYARNSPEEQRFSAIASRLAANLNSLPTVLQDAFSTFYTTRGELHDELIVRIAEMIVTNNEQQAQTAAPELLQYYRETFLPKVRQHCAALEKRALSGWPKEMLTPPNNITISLNM